MNQEQATAQAEKIFNSAADYFDHPVMSFWDRFGRRRSNTFSFNLGIEF